MLCRGFCFRRRTRGGTPDRLVVADRHAERLDKGIVRNRSCHRRRPPRKALAATVLRQHRRRPAKRRAPRGQVRNGPVAEGGVHQVQPVLFAADSQHLEDVLGVVVVQSSEGPVLDVVVHQAPAKGQHAEFLGLFSSRVSRGRKGSVLGGGPTQNHVLGWGRGGIVIAVLTILCSGRFLAANLGRGSFFGGLFGFFRLLFRRGGYRFVVVLVAGNLEFFLGQFFRGGVEKGDLGQGSRFVRPPFAASRRRRVRLLLLFCHRRGRSLVEIYHRVSLVAMLESVPGLELGWNREIGGLSLPGTGRRAEIRRGIVLTKGGPGIGQRGPERVVDDRLETVQYSVFQWYDRVGHRAQGKRDGFGEPSGGIGGGSVAGSHCCGAVIVVVVVIVAVAAIVTTIVTAIDRRNKNPWRLVKYAVSFVFVSWLLPVFCLGMYLFCISIQYRIVSYRIACRDGNRNSKCSGQQTTCNPESESVSVCNAPSSRGSRQYTAT
mmetsp:Transcript_25097/g.59234  ORF Transcript_25097/g.59234 Transcript_25097/m.59234 type:complete len:489 (+) Transcript_25097:633-2099(+)